jgi:hypothetical protein
MKHSSIVGLAFVLSACDVGASDDMTSNVNPERRPSTQKTLSFYVGSVRECTPEYAHAGLCAPSDLTRCIVTESHYEEKLACKVVAKAALHSVEENFSRLYTSTTQFDVLPRAGKVVTCFDFHALELPSWTFERFTSFQGHCQKGTVREPVQWRCDPERTTCTSFDHNQSTCLPGWPCLKLYIETATMRKSTCTEDLVGRGACSMGDSDAFVCVTSSNRGPAALRCDLRLNVEEKRESGTVLTSSLLRGSMFYAGDQDEVCFRIAGVSDPDAVRPMKMNAVCRQKDGNDDLSGICDLGKDTCENESKVLEYVY